MHCHVHSSRIVNLHPHSWTIHYSSVSFAAEDLQSFVGHHHQFLSIESSMTLLCFIADLLLVLLVCGSLTSLCMRHVFSSADAAAVTFH